MKASVHVFISSPFKPYPIVATTYSSLHLLLPFDAATTSPTFLYELNYATLHKTTHPQRFFSMWHSLFYVHLQIQQTTSYKFRSSGETRAITHHITCNSKSFIYTIQGWSECGGPLVGCQLKLSHCVGSR